MLLGTISGLMKLGHASVRTDQIYDKECGAGKNHDSRLIILLGTTSEMTLSYHNKPSSRQMIGDTASSPKQ